MKLFLNGVMLDSNKNGLVKVYDLNHNFIGIGISINGKLKRKIIPLISKIDHNIPKEFLEESD